VTSTNLIKWDDTNNRLTAYCSDDTGETELGPVKWDDTNNKLELNCDSTDFQAKWDDTGNTLEARSVADGCCGSSIPVQTGCHYCCTLDSYGAESECPRYIYAEARFVETGDLLYGEVETLIGYLGWKGDVGNIRFGSIDGCPCLVIALSSFRLYTTEDHDVLVCDTGCDGGSGYIWDSALGQLYSFTYYPCDALGNP